MKNGRIPGPHTLLPLSLSVKTVCFRELSCWLLLGFSSATMSKSRAATLIIALVFTATSADPISLVRDLVQFNLAGHPVLHKSVEWPFDPEIGIRRSRQYQELNGRLGEKAIERLGLGIDGYDQERLAKQQERDEGHLNGIDYLTP